MAFNQSLDKVRHRRAKMFVSQTYSQHRMNARPIMSVATANATVMSSTFKRRRLRVPGVFMIAFPFVSQRLSRDASR
jgi:hypothetical protein